MSTRPPRGNWSWLSIPLWIMASSWSLAATVQVAVVDALGQPLPDAVVMLDSPRASQAVRPLAQAEMGQKDKRFQPELLVVTRGTMVSFPNRDTVRHHVYSFSPAKRFELKLYVGTPANPVVFDMPGVAVLGCNIHDQMMASVVVVDTPYHGRTANNGQAALSGVPMGAYKLRVWHQRLPVGAPAQGLDLLIARELQSITVRLVNLEAP